MSPAPRETVTTTIVILSTTYVTPQDSTATVPISSIQTTITQQSQQTIATPTSSSASSSHTSSASGSTYTTLPATLPRPSSSSPTYPVQSQTATATSTPSALPTTQPGHSHTREAVIGGLSGSIAGLVLIGLLICLCLRRRRRKEEGLESQNEKGGQPSFAHKVSEFATSKGTPRTPAPMTQPGSTPHFEGSVIRVSLDQFQRPFRGNEGWRDSVAPGALRVTNPDLSRPNTPKVASDNSPRGFLQRQRSALAAVLLNNASRSRPSSTASGNQAQPTAQLPTIHIDEALSKECIAPMIAAPAPSFRSYNSGETSLMVIQQPPEDPFITPPTEPTPLDRLQRPSLAPVQSSAGRTLSYFSSVLHPFRTKSTQVVTTVRPVSNSSAVSSRLSYRGTTHSYPFDLESIMHREGSVVGQPLQQQQRDLSQNWMVYEGT